MTTQSILSTGTTETFRTFRVFVLASAVLYHVLARTRWFLISISPRLTSSLGVLPHSDFFPVADETKIVSPLPPSPEIGTIE